MIESRMPKLAGTTTKAASEWFARLHMESMLFCLDEDPKSIFLTSNGERVFSDYEAVEYSKNITILFLKLGDKLHELAFNEASKTFHTPEERRAFKTMYG